MQLGFKKENALMSKKDEKFTRHFIKSEDKGILGAQVKNMEQKLDG